MANTAKYEFTGETQIVKDFRGMKYEVKRIRALREIEPPALVVKVNAGDLGGWIESESNLSQSGECWVDEEAVVMENAVVKDDAYVCDSSVVDGNAIICDQGSVNDDALVSEHAIICGNAVICEYAQVLGHITVKGNVKINGCAVLKDTFRIKIDDPSLDAEGLNEANSVAEAFYESNRGVIDGNIVITSEGMITYDDDTN